MYFNSNLKYLREKMGLSLNSLSKELGVNKRVLESYETNTVPKLSILNAFKEYYSTNVEQISFNKLIYNRLEDKESEEIKELTVNISEDLNEFVILQPKIPTIIQSEWGILVDEILLNNDRLYGLDWREYEKFVGYLFEMNNYEVKLMQGSKDDGIDLIVNRKLDLGINVDMVVQCKRYSKNRKVQLKYIKELYATKLEHKFDLAMITTTSYFTKGAIEKAEKYKIQTKDFDNMIRWCKNIKNNI